MAGLRARCGQHNLALLLVCQIVTTLGMMTVVPVLPQYVAALSTPLAAGAASSASDAAALMRWSNLALAAPGLGTLCCAPLAGRACARLGYRRVLLLSLLCFVTSMLAMALSQGLALFIAGRLLQGASTIGLVLTIFIGRISSDHSRGRNFGLQESAVAAGSLLGPLLGGVLLDYWSLRPMLLASAVVTGVSGALLWQRLQEPAQTDAATTASGTRYALRHLLRQPLLRNWMLAACLTQAAGFAMLTVFAQFIPLRFSTLQTPGSVIGTLHALGWLATMLASPLWGRANDGGDDGHIRRRFLLATAGCALSSALLMTASQLWMVAVLRLAQGACYAALAQSTLLACLRQLPASAASDFTGLARSVMVLGQLLGPLLVIACAGWLTALQLPWLVSLLFVTAGVLVWSQGKHRLVRDAAHPSQPL